MAKIRKAENRLQFSINKSAHEDAAEIANYYDEPIQKILLPEVLDLIKKKRAMLPPKITPMMK
jgi:hypothetical protein